MLSRENVMREALSEMENQRAKNLSEEKKRRDEAERLKKEVDQLSRQREELLEQSRALSTENASRLTEFIAGQMSCLSGAGEQRGLLCITNLAEF